LIFQILKKNSENNKRKPGLSEKAYMGLVMKEFKEKLMEKKLEKL